MHTVIFDLLSVESESLIVYCLLGLTLGDTRSKASSELSNSLVIDLQD